MEYFNYKNFFLVEYIVKFLEYTGINDYVIESKKSKQLFLSPAYSLKLIEFETLKTYIKTNLANGFI